MHQKEFGIWESFGGSWHGPLCGRGKAGVGGGTENQPKAVAQRLGNAVSEWADVKDLHLGPKLPRPE